MSKIIDWFEKTPNESELWHYIKRVFAIETAILIAFTVASLVHGELGRIVQEAVVAMRERANQPSPDIHEPIEWARMASRLALGLFTAGVLAPVVEEFIFRLLPISLAILMFGWSPLTKPLIILVACCAGVAFGLVHLANEGTTVSSVLLLQGTGGIMYGILFAKVSGLRARGLLRAYRVTVFLHAAWNVFIVPLFIVLLAVVLTGIFAIKM